MSEIKKAFIAIIISTTYLVIVSISIYFLSSNYINLSMLTIVLIIGVNISNAVLFVYNTRYALKLLINICIEDHYEFYMRDKKRYVGYSIEYSNGLQIFSLRSSDGVTIYIPINNIKSMYIVTKNDGRLKIDVRDFIKRSWNK